MKVLFISQFAGSAHGTVSLVEGKVSADFYLPGDKGFDLVELIKLKENKTKDSNKKCPVRVKAGLGGYLFVGASANATLALPNIDVKKMDLNTQLSGSAFAGGSAGGKFSVCYEWENNERKWNSLCEAKFLADARLGIGGGWDFSCGLGKNDEGETVFNFRLKANATLGLGGKLGAALEIGIDEGFFMATDLLQACRYHFCDEIEGDAFEFVSRLALTGLTLSSKLNPAAISYEIIKGGANWMADWVKEFNSDQKLTEQKKQLRNGILNNDELLQQATPETLGTVLVALTKDYNKGDEEAIIRILESAESHHEFKWIVRHASGITLPSTRHRAYPSMKNDLRKNGFEKGWDRLVKHSVKDSYKEHLFDLRVKHGIH